MNVALVAALTVGLVSADIGIGYNYKPPTSYGAPSYKLQSSTGEYNTGYDGSNAWQNIYRQQSLVQGNNHNHENVGYPVLQYGNSYNNVGVAERQGLSGGQYYLGSGSNSGVRESSFSQPAYQLNTASANSGYQSYNQYQTSGQYQNSAAQKYQQFYNQLQQQPPQIFKHFYVHAAPEEPEIPRTKVLTLPPPQKHYKIIFIKAPLQPAAEPQLIPVPQQNEEKTIVYVLVKKPEEQPEIQLPRIEPKPQAKPEVFFIKYNNKDDKSVINNIVSDYNKVDTVSFNTDGSGQYLGSQQGAVGSGHYSQTSNYNSQGSTGNTGFYNLAGGPSRPSNSQYYPSSSINDGSVISTTASQTGHVLNTVNQASRASFDSESNDGLDLSVALAGSAEPSSTNYHSSESLSLNKVESSGYKPTKSQFSSSSSNIDDRLVSNIVGSQSAQSLGDISKTINQASRGSFDSQIKQGQQHNVAAVSSGQYSQSSSTNQQGSNAGSYKQASSANYKPANSQYTSFSSSEVPVSGTDIQSLLSVEKVLKTEKQGSYGSLVNGGQGFNIASADADSGESSAAATSSTSSFNIKNLVSTSQQVPHESYGPPTFNI